MRVRLALVSLLSGCHSSALPGGSAGPPDASSIDGPPGAPPVSLPPSHGGARLEVESRWTTADGVQGPLSLNDPQFGEHCSFVLFDDGKYRCLPLSRTFVGPTWFVDPQCQRPAYIYTRTSCTQPSEHLLTASATLTCPASLEVHARGPLVEGRTAFRRDPGGQCQGLTDSDPATEVYELGALEPPSLFVAATVKMAAPTGTFAPLFLEGEDGTVWSYGFRDLAGHVDCRLPMPTAADGQKRCLPSPVAVSRGEFADAACTTPAAVANRTSCAVGEAFVWGERIVDCASHAVVFRAGERLAQSFHVLLASGSCTPSRNEPDDDILVVGAEIDPAGYVALSQGIVDAPGRLKRFAVTTPAGTYATNEYWDSRLRSPCFGILAKDDTHRCAPLPREVPTVYADAACTWPIFIATPCTGGYVLQAVPDSCPARYQVFAAGAVLQTDVYYSKAAGACRAFRLQPTATPRVLREFGAELLPEKMVELSQRP